LLQRLKDDRMMYDGTTWSVQADFSARLADWDTETDEQWSIQRVERDALLDLTVPIFTTPSDAGVRRASSRIRQLDRHQIDWQVEVIRQTSPDLSTAWSPHMVAVPSERVPRAALSTMAFLAEADTIAQEVSAAAIRKGPGAAWIGLGWFPDSDVSQLAVVGHDLYNGVCGIAMFLAAHATIAKSADSADLALAAVAALRSELRGSRAARLGRVLGIGGATGLGSIAYGLQSISTLLNDDGLGSDALGAARLFTDDLIASDTQLDVIGGSAGAILCLLRLFDDTQDGEVLERALSCGAHLLKQQRQGPVGARSWPCRVSNGQPLTGMSHGAAGFAYSLAALASASGRDEFDDAAMECLAFERSQVDFARSDWRDMSTAEPHLRSQWCHGSVGIGLAWLGMHKLGRRWPQTVERDIDQALSGSAHGWSGHADTLCCGALGSVELTREAGKMLGRTELRELSALRLAAILQWKSATGGYRWSAPVSSRFNVGLFRGLAGVGYTCLRQIDESIPNVLIWQ
jgi:type 2 lantibiotic biosynthesis protein LanM